MPTETAEAKALGEVWDAIAELAQLRGESPINKLPGCWVAEAGPWTLVLNGHREPQQWRDITVQPFHCYAEFNGWPAGVFTPYAGTVAAGSAANIFLLRGAILKAVAEAKP